MSEPNFVIVQAGGRGSRLRHHTWNKPKCLVSIHGKPILYHLFDRFPGASFIIIGDYLFDQLEAYVALNPPPNSTTLVRATGSGTCAGIADALEMVPSSASATLVWSDLYLKASPTWPSGSDPILCITAAFACRWSSSENGELAERTSQQRGVPGLFHLPNPGAIPPVPTEGEFVRWWSENIAQFATHQFDALEELGDFATIEQLNDREGFSRFFNDVKISERSVTKTVVDPKFVALQKNELSWYRDASALGFERIPKVLADDPLTLERIFGQHAFQMTDLTTRERRAVIMNYIDTLSALHRLADAPADTSAAHAVYVEKSIQRVGSVARIIPGIEQKSLTVNGRKCRNPFAQAPSDFWDRISKDLLPTRFNPIHGDPTFSNSLIDRNLRVWFIDPRGYFKDPGIYGDAMYDFAKVYYSAVGNYDAFNRRKFKLYVDGTSIEVLMEESPFAATARELFSEHFGADFRKIQLIHALIWLSLTGYVRDDIDSILGAFYLGLYWLEEGLNDE